MTTKYDFHESYSRRGGPKTASDRSVGITFAAVFAIVGAWPLLDGETPRVWSFAVAFMLLAAALKRPALLKLLGRAWGLVGRLLHRIVSPIVLAILFYAVVAPTGLIMRLMGKDPLRLRLAPEADTYWIERTPPGPSPESMKRQF